ncbi:MAG: TrkH family potassium uptake protein [candidate division KSB1 bacterium]|nr:TrkH family potassium uptake protein [candidate division KSB1 bacterium]
MINFRAILHVLFALMLFLGFSLLIPTGVAFIYQENDLLYLLACSLGILLIGGVGYWLSRIEVELRIKDGFVIVTAGWLLFAAFGALPFYLSGYIPSYTDAFFETMSGFTTTGASILTNIEALPHGLLFWRSFTHWIGGMGIILLSLAILPLLGIGGMQLYKAEVPGPSPDKLSPRIRETAKLLWGVYFLLSAIETLLLWLAGMTFFDAVCHTFGTMATGGFSTKNASIGHYNDPLIDSIIILFMVIAGANFALHYRALRGKLDYLKDPEFKLYFAIILLAVLFVGLDVLKITGFDWFLTLRQSAFQVVSILTTTGYGTADYESWSASSQLLLLILMFLGGCAGSTGGGIKVIRPLVLFKFGQAELKRLVHPQAVLPVRVGKKAIQKEIVTNIAGFFLFYIGLFVVGSLIMSAMGLDLITAIGSVAATIGNIGPGLGNVGPTDNYASIPVLGKWFLSFLMLAGRLEIYTVIILFSRSFWQK